MFVFSFGLPESVRAGVLGLNLSIVNPDIGVARSFGVFGVLYAEQMLHLPLCYIALWAFISIM